MPPLGKPTNFGKKPHTYAEKKAERESERIQNAPIIEQESMTDWLSQQLRTEEQNLVSHD